MTHPEHFSSVNGTIAPQPWMQLRRVATTSTPSVARSYGPTGGKAKNETLQSITAAWSNHTPLDHYVYGLVHQGGCAVSLHVRSRGYIAVSHALKVELTPKAVTTADLVEVSRFGGGADIGMGGLLATGTAFGIHEVRSHSTSIPLRPDLTGWKLVKSGETVSAQVDSKFISEFWENTTVAGGNTNTNSTVIAGDLGMDLFAVPVIAAAPPRLIPTVVTTATGKEISKPVTITKPAGVVAGDILLAICGNQFGNASDITPPNDPLWKTLHVVDQGWESTHVKVFVKVATGSEPASYTFGNGALAEEVVELMVLRSASAPGGDMDNSGWSVSSTQTKWAKTGDMHVCPSISSNGQLLLCFTFFALTDSPLDQVLGPVPVKVTVPSGMNTAGEKYGQSSTLSVATIAKPPNPTGAKQFISTPRAFFANRSVNVSILVPGTQQF